MAIITKTATEIATMRKGGKILAETLQKLKTLAKPGISTKELDEIAENYIRSQGASPSFKGYHGYPATICAGINEVVVHGIPKANDIIKEGDLVTLDCGVLYDEFHTDSAISFTIGQTNPKKEKMVKVAEEALYTAIDLAQPGRKISELSKVIEKIITKAGFYVIEDLTGHGIGRNIHEDPIVLNYYSQNQNATLKPGMTIAIEPIFSASTKQIRTLADDWTIVTADNSCSVQVEHTIAITQDGNEVLTKL